MRMKSVLLIMFGLLLAAGCASARPFTDSAGRTVEVPDRIGRVLTAGPPASVLIYVLAPEKLAGWVREPLNREKEFLLPSVRGLPTFGRLTGKGGTANMEAVLSARPDVIIDVGTINPTYISLADKVQEQTGIPYILVDGTFSKTPDSLRQVGTLLGVGPRAEELAAYAEVTMKHLKDGLEKVPTAQRPSIYYGRGPDGLETGLAGSINLEILDVVGASNVAAAAGKGGLTNVSVEQVLAWNPQVVLAADPAFTRSVRSNPSWATVPAVNENRVYPTPSLPFGWFDSPPGVNRLIGVRWLEALLYPDAFHADLDAEVKRFFKLFYQVDLTEPQVNTLLKGAMPTRP